ncbi:hypothetical protein GCM10023237_08130 [Streptomyces coeruleoprunus]
MIEGSVPVDDPVDELFAAVAGVVGITILRIGSRPCGAILSLPYKSRLSAHHTPTRTGPDGPDDHTPNAGG